MRRAIVLGQLLFLGMLRLWAAGFQNPPADPAPLKTQKVRDNLYMIVGKGGNTAVFVTDAGVVVVDTKNPGNGQAILDQIKTVTSKPVTMIINTHTHSDHVGNNAEFPAAVDFVAQENTKVRASCVGSCRSRVWTWRSGNGEGTAKVSESGVAFSHS
jgi:cyclase